ncbi:type-F conjugative transfer system secretin TraK [Aliivibrio wodanis]|uniref:type-F conjugative transfer system secretin TraK n=1 Tax=Aliivibrio wodanis TaxID=80852 RepID=UPI00406CD5F3
MNKSVLLLALLSSSVLAAPASQLGFSNNETLTVKLSSVDINRLIVANDKITSVVCPTAFCTLPMGNGADGVPIPLDPSGAALISLNVEEPFTFYVSTQKGKNFGVFATPLRIPAITTEFISTDRDTTLAAKFETNAPYQDMLVQLMQSMMRFDELNLPPEGFILTNIEEKEREPVPLDVIPKRLFSGDTFSGLMYEVKNNTTKSITLTNTRFYVRGLRALSLDKKTLAPNESTRMYQIVSGEFL